MAEGRRHHRTPSSLEVKQEGQKEKYASENIRSPNYASHSLAVYGVDGEHHASDEDAGNLPAEYVNTHKDDQKTGQGVENHVDEMISKRFQLSKEIVEAESGRANGAKGLVASRVPEWCAPEVVGHEHAPWG